MSFKYSIAIVFVSLFITATGQVAWNMELLDQWDDDYILDRKGVKFNDIWGYVDCDGTEYAIMGSQKAIHFFNLSNPNEVTETARLNCGGESVWRDFKTYKNFVYAVADEGREGLLVANLAALPEAPRFVLQDNTTFQKAHNIYIDEANARLYVAGANSQFYGLIVYDISNPANPVLIGKPKIEAGNYVHDVYVRDHIAYCSQGWDGFFVWDYTDPEAPVLLANLETVGYNHSSWLTTDGQYAFYTEEVPKGVPVGVVDVSNFQNGEIELVHEFIMPLIEDSLNVTPHNPFVVNNFLIISYYEDGVQLFDVSDPEEVVKIAYYDTEPNNTEYNGTKNNWGVYPFFPSGIIIASDTRNGLFVLRPTLEDWNENTIGLASEDCSSIEAPVTDNADFEGLRTHYVFQENNQLQLYFHFDIIDNIDFSLYNSSGQLLKTFVHSGRGIFKKQMEIGNYATGIYWLVMQKRGTEEFLTIPFVKQ